MMHRSNSTNCCRRGLTLIEVVAGLALMGTLLAAMLSGKSRFTGQYHHAQRVLTAVELLDAFLIDRWPAIGEIDDSDSGDFAGESDMTWRISVVDDPVAADWHCRVVRVEVLDANWESDEPPLASVDLLVPDPPQEVSDVQDTDAVQANPLPFEDIRPDAGELNRLIPTEAERESPVFGERR